MLPVRGYIGVLGYLSSHGTHRASKIASQTANRSYASNAGASGPPQQKRSAGNPTLRSQPARSKESTLIPRKKSPPTRTTLIQAAAKKTLAEQARQEHFKKVAVATANSNRASSKTAVTANETVAAHSASSQTFSIASAYKKARSQINVQHAERTKEDANLPMMERQLYEAAKMGQRLDLAATLEAPVFDVHIPLRLQFRTLWNDPKHLLRTVDNRFSNFLKNATSIYLLAFVDSLPGISLGHAGLIKRWTQWIWQSTRVASVRPSAWVAGMREACLDTYRQLVDAVASGNLQSISSLTTRKYRQTLPPSVAIGVPQKFGALGAPVRVVSLRSGLAEPNTTKYIVQALVRFESTRIMLGTSVKHAPTSAGAEPTSTVEYLIMEKKMWLDGPWLVKEKVELGEGSTGRWDRP